MKKGILLINLGSPASPSVRDVRRYLNEFLMDERVIDAPGLIRWIIVKLFILPFRPGPSAHAYQSIWQDEGSPLIVLNQRLLNRLREKMADPVALAMRYGQPSVESGLSQLIADRVTEIFLIPLYPHYAMSTVETSVVQVRETLHKIAPNIKLTTIPPFYDHPDYIDALAASARPHLSEDYDHLLFSYHGLPERHLKKTDPTGQHCLLVANCCRVESPAHDYCYKHQCLRTTAEFVRKLKIPAGTYTVAFQSRLGRDPWLTPFSDEEMIRLARAGIKRLAVICPSFITDCLETLEEIGLRGKKLFLENGGDELRLIPCLNDHPQWVETLANWCHGLSA